ncbi:MAG: hypothetical protein ABI548_00500, partial [Polyangiaceae bacterium]
MLGCQVLFGGVEVTRTKASGPDSCLPGDFRCNGEYLLECGSADTGWMLSDSCASQDLCDAKNKTCSVCRDGDVRCSGADRQQCASDGASWNTVQQCDAANLCSGSSCGACPIDGALDCSSGAKLRECHAGVWQELDNCASAAVCTATIAQAMSMGDSWDRKCAVPGCSPPGSYDCQDATLRRCRLDQSAWDTVDTCVSVALCAATVAQASGATAAADGGLQGEGGSDAQAGAIIDACKVGCPAPNAFFCDGTTLEQCSADQVGYATLMVCPTNTECDPTAGVCGALCTPGHYQCNSASLRKCGPDGHWKDDTACETPELCDVNADGTQGQCLVSPCGADAFRCTGAALEKCKTDRTGYQPADTCASAALCDAKSQRCITPTCAVASAYQCFGQDLKQCAADFTTWNPIKTCPAGQYCDSGANPGCLTSCPANPLRCNGNVLQQCSAAGGWATKATCATADLCNCTQTVPPSCLNGVFKDGCGNVACGGSTLPTYQCQGTDLQKCQAGRNGWDTTSKCGPYIYPPYQSLCYSGSAPAYDNGYCVTCPVAGELSCNAAPGTLFTCSADRRSWTTTANCPNGCVGVNLGDDYCSVCKAGDVRCTGAVLQNCPANARDWNSTTSCATPQLCDAAKAICDPPVCAVGQKTCVGAVLKVCNAGRTGYDVSSTCASAALCNQTTLKCDTPTCMPGQQQCNGAQLQTCNADQTGWNSVACASAALCNKTTLKCDPATCMAGQQQCSGAQLQTCNANLNGYDSINCASAALCNKTTLKCDPATCMAGQQQCSGAILQTCNANLNGYDTTTCASAALCDSAMLVCHAPTCMLTQHHCNSAGTTLQDCSMDLTQWVDEAMPCAYGCSGSACNPPPPPVCTPSTTSCTGLGSLTFRTCNATGSQWTDQTCVSTCDATAGCDAPGPDQ